jgi:hypothetical protein
MLAGVDRIGNIYSVDKLDAMVIMLRQNEPRRFGTEKGTEQAGRESEARESARDLAGGREPVVER